MIHKDATIKNRVLTLPERFRCGWDNTKVFLVKEGNILFIKRKEKKKRVSLARLKLKLKAAGRSITDKDIEDAVAAARGKF